MKRPERFHFLKYFLFVLEIFILFIIGETPGILPTIAGALPSLMVCTAVSIALSGVKELTAMSFGIFCGLLMDFSRGGPYGFHAIIFAIVCYFIALLVQNLFQKNLISALIMTILTVILVYFLQWLFFYVIPGYNGIGYVLLHHFLPRTIYTLVAAIPIYFLTRGLSSLFRSV